jgi:hypothetical protein
MSDTTTEQAAPPAPPAPNHRPGTRAKENSVEDAWLREQIAAGVAALPEDFRRRLHEEGDRLRVVTGQMRMVNNVPAAMFLVWPFFIWWLLPAAFRAQKMFREPVLKPLLALAEDLYRPNWVMVPEGNAVDDIIAMRDQRSQFGIAIFMPLAVYVGIAFVALVLLQ